VQFFVIIIIAQYQTVSVAASQPALCDGRLAIDLQPGNGMDIFLQLQGPHMAARGMRGLVIPVISMEKFAC